MSREYTYGYWSLQLFGGQIVLPIKMLTSNKPDNDAKLPTVRGLDGKKTKQIYVSVKKGREGVNTVKDIDEFVESWTELDTYLDTGNGSLKKFSEFPGLEELVAENERKKKETDMEVLGIYDSNQISPKFFNGRQYYLRSGLPKEKVVQPVNRQIYQCLSGYLEENDLYIVVRYFSRSGEELGVIFSDNEYLRLSGIYPSKNIRELSPMEKISDDSSLIEMFYEKLDEFREDQDEHNPEPILVLDWHEFYIESLKNKGIVREIVPKGKKVSNASPTGTSLLDMLKNIGKKNLKKNKNTSPSLKKSKKKNKKS